MEKGVFPLNSTALEDRSLTIHLSPDGVELKGITCAEPPLIIVEQLT